MTYTPEMKELIKVVEATRMQRIGQRFPSMTMEERDQVLNSFHPDYIQKTMRAIRVGVNKGSHAQPAGTVVEVVRLRPNIFVIAGSGSNITVQTGPDGLVLVDAGTVEAVDPVLAELRRISDQPIRYIINTGWDADHVAGNGKLAMAGRNIFAAGPEPVGGEFARAMTNPY